MKITITGASGFVGKHLTRAMIEQGYAVTAMGRSLRSPFTRHDSLTWVPADTTRPGPWQDHIAAADIVINLTGKSVFGYWTDRRKAEIYKSRIETTKNITAALSRDRKTVLLSTSAIGYYGDRGEDELTETEGPGDDFLASVCMDWEKAALAATEKGCRVVCMRFGVVLGSDGGALKQMRMAFRSFAGGPLGSGTHWFPWIHMDDLVAAIGFVMESPDLSGAVNFCAPQAVRQKTFAQQLGQAMGRPARMPAPAFMLKIVMGEMSRALMSSQKAVPAVLKSRGFRFRFPELVPALADLLS